MIVCVCASVNQSAVDSAIKSGIIQLEELQAELDVCNRCCCCEDAIVEMINSRLEALHDEVQNYI